MVFRNILLGAVLIAATAFASSADSTTSKNIATTDSKEVSVYTAQVSNTSSLKKQKTIIKDITTWSKIKDLFE